MEPALVEKQVAEGKVKFYWSKLFSTQTLCLSVQVTDHLHTVFSQRKSPNKLKVKMIIGAKPWLADPKHALYEAGKRAVKRGQMITSSHDYIIMTSCHVFTFHCSHASAWWRTLFLSLSDWFLRTQWCVLRGSRDITNTDRSTNIILLQCLESSRSWSERGGRFPSLAPSRTSRRKTSSCCPSEALMTAFTLRTRKSAGEFTQKWNQHSPVICRMDGDCG